MNLCPLYWVFTFLFARPFSWLVLLRSLTLGDADAVAVVIVVVVVVMW